MEYADSFFSLVLDGLAVSVAVIAPSGRILYVNRTWVEFGCSNGEPDSRRWLDSNYLDVCEASSDAGDALGAAVLTGIRSVINGESESFAYEYPCHSPDQQRWFQMRVSPMEYQGQRCCVIAHHNITERHLAEQQVLRLSRTDGLTGISNRRYFEEFYSEEWRRCRRAAEPISLILFDVDHFKQINDRYGHPAGDEVLRQIADCAGRFARRPGDLCARYGGEEFVIVLGGTGICEAIQVAERLQQAVGELSIPNELSPIAPFLTISEGVQSVIPRGDLSPDYLIKQADKMLYTAKRSGRNRIGTPAEIRQPSAGLI